MLKDSPYVHQSELYLKFLGIGLKKYRKVILFYEDNQIQIMALHSDEYFELFITYINALFEIGEHEKFLQNIDEGIELSIARHFNLYRGEDLYHKLLFRKAACMYHQMRYPEAKYILEELIKIQPWNNHSISFLKKCIRAEQPSYVRHSVAVGVVILVLTAITIAIEIFLVRQYYQDNIALFELSRNVMFVVGAVILLSGTVLHYLKVNQSVEKFVAQQRKRKRQLKQKKTSNKVLKGRTKSNY